MVTVKREATIQTIPSGPPPPPSGDMANDNEKDSRKCLKRKASEMDRDVITIDQRPNKITKPNPKKELNVFTKKRKRSKEPTDPIEDEQKQKKRRTQYAKQTRKYGGKKRMRMRELFESEVDVLDEDLVRTIKRIRITE